MRAGVSWAQSSVPGTQMAEREEGESDEELKGDKMHVQGTGRL